MDNTKLYAIVSVAIPKIDKLNTLASKVSLICISKKRADSLSKIIKDNQKNIIYGLECDIYTSVVPVDFHGTLKDKIYAVLSTAIPKERKMNPVQSNIHSAYSEREEAEKVAGKILSQQNLIVKGHKCNPHVSIIEVKLDRNE